MVLLAVAALPVAALPVFSLGGYGVVGTCIRLWYGARTTTMSNRVSIDGGFSGDP